MAGESLKPGVTEAVDIAVEALTMANMTGPDPEEDAERLTTDFQALLKGQRRHGELYPQVVLPRGTAVASVRALFDLVKDETVGSYGIGTVSRAGNGRQYSPSWINNIDIAQSPPSRAVRGRLALHRPKSQPGNSQADRLLHFTDDTHSRDGGRKQRRVPQVRAVQEEYEGRNPGFNLGILNIPALAMIALQHKIKGEALPLEWNYPYAPLLVVPTLKDGSHFIVGIQPHEFSLFSPWERPAPDMETRGVGFSAGFNGGQQR